MNLRPEIKVFCDAAETLLSPVMMQTSFTEDELALLRLYMENLEKMVAKGTAATAPTRHLF